MGKVSSGVLDDSKQLELINTAIEKTREGRLRWHSETVAYEADLPDGGQLVFLLSSPRTLGGRTWDLFLVRRRDGTEILAVQHTDSSVLGGTIGTEGSPLENAVAELFGIVTGSARVEVDKVIEQIKNL